MEDATQQCWQNGRPYFPLKSFQDMAKAQKLLHLVISVLSCFFETTWGHCYWLVQGGIITYLPASMIHDLFIIQLFWNYKMRVILVYNSKFVWTTMKKQITVAWLSRIREFSEISRKQFTNTTLEILFQLFLGEAFDYLDAPVYRITGADIPTPYANNLEYFSLPQVENVVRTVKKVLNLEWYHKMRLEYQIS